MKGKVEVFAPAKAFPTPPLFLNDITVDPESGTLFVSDSGDLKGRVARSFASLPRRKSGVRIRSRRGQGRRSWSTSRPIRNSAPQRPGHGRTSRSCSWPISAAASCYRIKLADKTHREDRRRPGRADGLAWDHFGRLFVSGWKTGKMFVIPRPGDEADSAGRGLRIRRRHVPRSDRQVSARSRHEGRHLDEVPANVPGAGRGRRRRSAGNGWPFPN